MDTLNLLKMLSPIEGEKFRELALKLNIKEHELAMLAIRKIIFEYLNSKLAFPPEFPVGSQNSAPETPHTPSCDLRDNLHH